MPDPTSEALVNLIQQAFKKRHRPDFAVSSNELTSSELEAVSLIAGLEWTEVGVNFWESHPDVLSWLSNESFCYYLQSVLVESARENVPNLAAVYSILYSLDRTPERELWNCNFKERWLLFTKEELSSIQRWVEWCSNKKPELMDDISFIRALLTIDLLIESVVD